MPAKLHHHKNGITWVEPGLKARSSHAIANDGQVWLIDAVDDVVALAAVAKLGTPAAVVQLLDRHGRDNEVIASRLGVPLLRMPAAIARSPFQVISVISHSRWKEIALSWPEAKMLIVAEAIGTAPPFALGRRAGVHPLLRALPPRPALHAFDPQYLLVGHGRPLLANARGALPEALDNARTDIPRLMLELPKMLLERR